MKESIRFWIGFNLVKGIGPVRLQSLLKVFGDVESAWNASPHLLRQIGLQNKLVEQILKLRGSGTLDEVLAKIEDQEISVLTWEDPAYPERLREIPQSPFVLYLKGELSESDLWAAAVVGTRRFTGYGKMVAEQVSRELARAGLTVISGLARGIDGIAHRCALDEGARTIAVLGSGVDMIYPPEHRNLAQRIAGQGAVISDYPPGTPPEGSNFPPRNRIISGLAKAVIVVEAGSRSGALITANYAADQGKEVFAVPGGIHSPQSKGTNWLLQQGAHPLLSSQDVLDNLELTMVPAQRQARQCLPSTPREALVYNALGVEPLHVDQISAEVDLPVEQVTSTLAMMELKGMVKKIYGMKYMAVLEKQLEYEPGTKQD